MWDPVWKGRSSGGRVDLGRVHRVQGRSGPCAPGAMSLMPYASGCNTLHALYIRVQCPAFMPCTSGCMDERKYIYAIAPRTHDQSSLCLCAWPLHLFPAKEGLSVCPFAIWIWWILRCRYFRVHTGPGKPGKGVNFLKSQGKSPGNFENSKKVLEKVLGNILLVLKKNYSIFILKNLNFRLFSVILDG